MTNLTILVTGGAGYVGSHTILELLNAGHNVICVDNLSNAYDDGNACPEPLRRVQNLTGKSIIFYPVDLRDGDALSNVFKKHKIDCVAHFAALKAVGESCRLPLHYYQNNITGTSVLLETMASANVFHLVYSSSATVYGEPQFLPITELHATGNCTSPYGKTKYFCEEIFKDVCLSDSRWSIISLRYFNPVGAHESGVIGEDPNGEPNNLMPYISQVAVGRRKNLKVYGNDYDTIDGTGVRDYIHVVDLAKGHINAIAKLTNGSDTGFVVYNLGTGIGFSVLQVIQAYSKASGRDIPYEIVERRAGDIAQSYSDVSLARKKLEWNAEKGLDEMCEDSWRWQQKNPNGYANKSQL